MLRCCPSQPVPSAGCQRFPGRLGARLLKQPQMVMAAAKPLRVPEYYSQQLIVTNLSASPSIERCLI